MSNPNAPDTKVYTGEWGAFTTSVVTNIIILGAIMVAFFILRAIRKNSYLYQPQYYDSVDRGNMKLPMLPRNPFGFFTTVIRFPSERVLASRGLDSYMFLRVIKMFTIMFICFLPGLAILIPVDKTADGGNDGIPGIGMSNVPQKSNRLYAHALVFDVYTLIALYLLYRLYKQYLAYRTQWMQSDEAHNYTVMFRGLPHGSRQAAAPQYFSTTFSRSNVVGAHYTADDDLLYEVIRTRDAEQKELVRAQAALRATGQRPQHKLKPLIGKKVDTIEHHERVIGVCNQMINEHRAMFDNNPSYSKVAFATFNTIGDAANVVKSIEGKHLMAKPAPQETDIFWDRLNRAASVTFAKKVIVLLLIFALTFLWAIPIVFIQGIANLQNLSRISAFSFLSGVNNWSSVPKGLIEQYLPPLFVIVFLALVPMIIRKIMIWRGVYTESELSREVMKKYFVFQLFNTFLVSLWAGGLFSVLEEIKNESGWDLISSIGSGIAAGTLFFINYVLVYALFKIPFGLLRIGDLIKATLKRRKGVTEEHTREIERPGEFKFDTSYVVMLLLFIIGFTYSVLNSFIVPFMMLVFFFNYVLVKYMLTWVYYPKWDSGGLHWPKFFNRTIASMLIGHVLIIIVLILRRSASAAVVAPAPILTLLFAFWIHRRFNGPCNVLTETSYPSTANGLQFERNYQDPIYRGTLEYNNVPTDVVINPPGQYGVEPGLVPDDVPINVVSAGGGPQRRSSVRRSSAAETSKSPKPFGSPFRSSPRLRSSKGAVYNEVPEEH